MRGAATRRHGPHGRRWPILYWTTDVDGAVSEVTGLSFGKMRALRRIAAKPMAMGELAALLGMDPPNLTAVVDDLERAGLVERQPHPTDRRAKLVVATAAGGALARRAEKVLERPPEPLSELPIDDLETLVRILSQVRAEGDPGR